MQDWQLTFSHGQRMTAVVQSGQVDGRRWRFREVFAMLDDSMKSNRQAKAAALPGSSSSKASKRSLSGLGSGSDLLNFGCAICRTSHSLCTFSLMTLNAPRSHRLT